LSTSRAATTAARSSDRWVHHHTQRPRSPELSDRQSDRALSSRMSRYSPQAKAAKAAKFVAVFSQRMAICLNRLSLPIACSIRARPRWSRFGKKLLSDGVGSFHGRSLVMGGSAIGFCCILVLPVQLDKRTLAGASASVGVEANRQSLVVGIEQHELRPCRTAKVRRGPIWMPERWRERGEFPACQWPSTVTRTLPQPHPTKPPIITATASTTGSRQ
jgi:hypothetical protein